MALNAPVMSPQDSSIVFKVKVELRVNPLTGNFARDVKVSAQRGVVTLEGTVPDEMSRKNAERVTLAVVNVARVSNKLGIAR